jgi:hypothetical protein
MFIRFLLLASFLVSLHSGLRATTNAGVIIDPNGRAVTNDGPYIDPNGAVTNAGSAMDPNGALDKGLGADPNG